MDIWVINGLSPYGVLKFLEDVKGAHIGSLAQSPDHFGFDPSIGIRILDDFQK